MANIVTLPSRNPPPITGHRYIMGDHDTVSSSTHIYLSSRHFKFRLVVRTLHKLPFIFDVGVRVKIEALTGG